MSEVWVISKWSDYAARGLIRLPTASHMNVGETQLLVEVL